MSRIIRASRVVTWALGLWAVGLSATATGAEAQGEPSRFCLSPGPASECRTFLLFEARGQSPFWPRERSDLHHSFGWDLGLAANVAHRWAVGGVVGYEMASDSRRWTLGGRVRRWLTPSIGLEAAPGVFRLIDEGLAVSGDRVGLNAAVRAMLWDVGVLGLRYDLLLPGTAPADTDTEHALYALGGIENVAGLAATTLGVVAILVGIGLAITAAG